jgi:hypothetical protein
MASRNEEIANIRTEITLTRDAFSARLHRLEERLNSLEDTDSQIEANPSQTLTTANNLQIPPANLSTLSADEKPEPISIALPKLASNKQTVNIDHSRSFASLLNEVLLPILSPFSNILSPLLKLYQHYQSKGQGPIFLFMLVGIALLVGGFGYLAQLLVGELGAGSKTLLLFVVSVGVTVGGDFLARTKTYAALGSATISLGLLLNFMTIYIAGSYYHLLSDWLVLVAYFVVGLSGFILSFRHSAQIINALAILGGGVIPLISHLDNIGTGYYLVGLAFLTMGSLFQATLKAWGWLNLLTVIVVSACLEYLLMFSDSSLIVGLFSELFYSIYILVVWQNLVQKKTISQENLAFFTLSLFASIGLIIQSQLLPEWSVTLISLANTVIWLALLIGSKKINKLGKSICVIFASIWLLVAIFTSLQQDFWGIAVGLEGLFLLYFALKENYQRLRTEAYGLLIFAVIHPILGLLPHFPTPALFTLKGNIALGSIGVFMFFTRQLVGRKARQPASLLSDWEASIGKSLRQIESVWLLLSVSALAWVYLHEWSLVVLIPLQGVFLWKSIRQRCELTEILVLIIIFGFAASIVYVALQIHSFSLRELPSFAQTTLLLVFIELWALCEYYRRRQLSGMLAELSESMRLGAYLVVPLLFLPSVAKHYTEFLSFALWCSVTIAYLLARFIKHPLIRFESLFLSLIAAIYTLFNLLTTSSLLLPSSIFPLITGVIYFAYCLRLVRLNKAALLENKLGSMALAFYAGILFTTILQLSHFYWAGLFVSFYCVALVLIHKAHPTILRNLTVIQNLIYLLMIVSWCSIYIASQSKLIAASLWLGFHTLLILQVLFPSTRLPQFTLTLLKHNSLVYPIHHLLLTTSVLLLLIGWELTLFIAPWLVLQGSYLFWTQKHNSSLGKIALAYVFFGLLKLGLIDAANALLWQKVALLIGIGLFMIIAAFAYQKRNAQVNNESSDIINHT